VDFRFAAWLVKCAGRIARWYLIALANDQFDHHPLIHRLRRFGFGGDGYLDITRRVLRGA
jgi:hypothetical protein